MGVDKIICNCKGVSYGDIRNTMVNGARTIKNIQEATGAGTGCGRCIPEIEGILGNVCRCKRVSLEVVEDAVKGGANTCEKVGEQTGAGTRCGRCKPLIQNIIISRE